MRTPARANSNHTPPYGVDELRQRPRTIYVDFARLESTVAGTDAVRAYRPEYDKAVPAARRVTTVDDEVTGLRVNVQDAARAVLTWLASVTQHDSDGNLDRVLNRCLRPGADASAVNFAAMADEINQSLGMDLSAKRVQTAVRHLRDAAAKNRDQASVVQTDTKPTLTQRFDALHTRLQANHDKLINDQGQASDTLRRAIAHDVLGVLRASAGRLIECGFGEGIPQHVDLDATRQRFLVFVQHTARGLGSDESCSVRDDLSRLLSALQNHDDTAEADMQLVVAGANVVADLAGPDSLPGLMARLNILMAGRPMLESDFFVSQMLELADAAGNLIDDKATHAYLGWVRHQPEDRQTPSPNRVRSYCLNNAATHILERLHTGELAGGHWFETAQLCFATMKKHDRGFKLLKTTEAIMLCVLAEMTGSTEPSREFFKRLGQAKSLDLLCDLRKFDNSDALNRLVRHGVIAVYPQLKGQLLVLPL
jgi:hypothetical protein